MHKNLTERGANTSVNHFDLHTSYIETVSCIDGYLHTVQTIKIIQKHLSEALVLRVYNHGP